MNYLAIQTETSLQDDTWTIRVVFDNLMFEQDIELFHEPDFVKAYVDFIMSFTRSHRVLAQYGHFGLVDRPFLEWLMERNIPFAKSLYSFSHVGDWLYEETDGGFEVVFEPQKRMLPQLVRRYAPTDHFALLVLHRSSQLPLQEVPKILTTPNAVGRVSEQLLKLCDWLILTEDDGETVVLKTKRTDAVTVVEAHLAPLRRAVN